MVEEYFEEDVPMEEKKETTEDAAATDKKKDESDEQKDVTEKGEETDPTPVEKKKKIKKTNLESSESRELAWSEASINKAHEVEVAMSNIDRIFVETGQIRNDLESYIYDIRDKVSSSNGLGNYASDVDKATFTSALEEMENWLYEDGYDATKSVYAEKLGELRAMGEPMEEREREAATRPVAMSALKHTVEKYNNWLNTQASDEKYAHIPEEDIKKAHDAANAAGSWMYEMLDKQGGLSPHQTPAVKAAEISAKCKELSNVVHPIMNKPKPKPKPVEKKEEVKVEEEKKEAAPDGESKHVPMETDESKSEETQKEEQAVPMDTTK